MTSWFLAQMDSERTRVVYEFARLKTIEGWWFWAAMIVVLVACLTGLVRFYRRDVAELDSWTSRTLIGLRLVVLLGLVFLFADLQRRTERTLTLPSEVAVLVDTSQSMTLPAGNTGGGLNRQQRVSQWFDQSALLSELSEQHRLNIYSFGEQSEAELLQATGVGTQAGASESLELEANQSGVSGEDLSASSSGPPSGLSGLALAGAILISGGVLLSLLSLLLGALRREARIGQILSASALTLGTGISLLAAVYAIESESSLSRLLTGQELSSSNPLAAKEDPQGDTDSSPASREVSAEKENDTEKDWSELLAPTDPQSRIGDAMQTVLNQHDPSTLAGIVLVTDGQNNGGSDVNAALSVARRNEISIYPVGVGSGDAPLNVRVVDLDAPRRVYPGDKFAVTATLQASGPNPVRIDVELLDSLDSTGDATGENLASKSEVIERQSIELPVDGSLVPVRFEMEPESVGQRRVTVRLVAPSEDQNAADNLEDAKYEVVAKKLKVLAIAGGPTREYRFVRNLFFRDRSIDLDVWLQTGQSGMSQDANQLLSAFPGTAQDLFEYDVVAMFDPDWTVLTSEDLDLLERWVSQQAGGLILVAGPVFHPKWTRLRTDPRVAKIAGLFPVTFSTRGAVVSSGRQGGEAAWPLELTPEARRAEFLWLDGDFDSSVRVWNDFQGVYDYVDTKEAKPASKVYAYFSDPTAQTGGTLPVYLASQFYGAGRTYFQASGEMWRIRGEGDQYFESYFTKLARWVSQGRLLRDSTRGVLLLDSETAMVGDSISVRAVLTDEQFEPLNVPKVEAKLLTPGGRIEDLTLLPLEGEPRAGTYGGQFLVRESGDYEIRVTLGDALGEQLLTQNLRVRLPTSELERPRRNDELLQRLAKMTSGRYLPINEVTTDTELNTVLLDSIRPQPQQSVLPGSYDQPFLIRRNAGLMWLLATFLTMEWIIRRLHRLA